MIDLWDSDTYLALSILLLYHRIAHVIFLRLCIEPPDRPSRIK